MTIEFGIGVGQDQSVHNVADFTATAEGLGYHHATMIDMKPVTEKARVASFDDERLYSDVLRQVREGDAITRTQASPWWICSSGRDALAAAQANEALTRQDWLQPRSNWVEARLEAVNHVDSEIIWAENRLRQ